MHAPREEAFEQQIRDSGHPVVGGDEREDGSHHHQARTVGRAKQQREGGPGVDQGDEVKEERREYIKNPRYRIVFAFVYRIRVVIA